MIWTWMNSWLFVAWPRYQLYFKNKKTVRSAYYARWWPLWSDLRIREEYEKQQDISFLKEIWKLNTGLKFCCEVQILSLMWEVKLGQEMKFQIFSKLWPENHKVRETQKHIFFSLPPLNSARRPPALFFPRRFMTESSRFKGSSSERYSRTFHFKD